MPTFECDPSVLFHCTPAENRHAIQEGGLEAPASLTIGWENFSFVGRIHDAATVAIFKVHAWDQPLWPDPDGPGHVRIRENVPPNQVEFVRYEQMPKGGW